MFSFGRGIGGWGDRVGVGEREGLGLQMRRCSDVIVGKSKGLLWRECG